MALAWYRIPEIELSAWDGAEEIQEEEPTENNPLAPPLCLQSFCRKGRAGRLELECDAPLAVFAQERN
jgi:hypothetical protein